MNVISGLCSGQVLQRGADSTGIVQLAGAIERGSGPVAITLRGDGWERTEPDAGTACGGSWSARVNGLPTGGPYLLEAACGDESCSVESFYIGEVWVLAGQSNMEGVGDLCDVEQPSPRVHVMDLADRWHMAEEPLHWLFESVDSAYWPCDSEHRAQCAREQRSSRTKGAGLGLAFGVALSYHLNVPVGLVVCARSGSSMQDWDPALLPSAGASLYGAMVRRIRKAGGVRGILWYQGESDSNPVESMLFGDRFRTLVLAVRRDLDAPDLALLCVQLGRHVAESSLADLKSWNVIQEAQRRAASQLANTAMVSTVDLDLDDGVHIGTQGLRRLGRRLATLSRSVVYGDRVCKSGPQLSRIQVEGSHRDRVRIDYGNVNGRLVSQGRLSGFSLRNVDGHHIPIIFKEEIDPTRANSVLLRLTRTIPPTSTLYYGWGRDPYCNLSDEFDMAAPVFGPVYP